MKLTLLLLFFLHVANGGKILFFMPVMPKSTTMTFLPLAQELAKKGHQVTIVNSKDLKLDKVDQIKLDYDITDKLAANYSKSMLSDKSDFGSFWSQIQSQHQAWKTFMFDSWDIIFHELKTKHNFFEKYDKFDVTIVYGFLTNEIGYYIAHRFNSSLVLYSAQQSSTITIDYAMGQPHNPAYLPSNGLTYKTPMNFKERLFNTLYAFAYVLNRNYYQFPGQEEILDKHFPDDLNRPSLLELEKNAKLALGYGHPLLMDGLRPVSPNYVHIGMLRCSKKVETLPLDIQKFLDEADEVILVSFGSVLQASQMSESLKLKLTSVFKKLKVHLNSCN